MRIVIDVQQAPGTSYFHLADVDYIHEMVEGMCLDDNAVIEVQVFAADGEDVDTVAFR